MISYLQIFFRRSLIQEKHEMKVNCKDNTPIIINSLPEILTGKILIIVRNNVRKEIDNLIKQILFKYNQELNKNDIIFSRSKNGKPFIFGSEIKFNISKTESTIVIAFTDNIEIGIDIEKISGEKIFSNQNIFFSGNEIELIQGDKTIITFFKLWTRKEAFLKFLGTGITENANNISLASDRNEIEIDSQSDEAYINSFMISDEIYCSVCTSKNKSIYIMNLE